MANPFIPAKAQPIKTIELRKSAGIFDDYAIRKNVASREATFGKSNFLLSPTTSSLVWNGAASSLNPLLSQAIHNSRTSYWKISGTDASPSTMSEGIFSIVPTFTTGITGTGANLLFFKPTDSRSISSGTNFTRAIRLEPNRSGTKTSTGSDDLFGLSAVFSDIFTLNASSGSTRRYGVQATSGSIITLSQGGQTFEIRNFLADGSASLINSSGTNTLNFYGLEIADTYAEAIVGGAITATKIGLYYHPTMTSAADTEYALLASRSGIGLLSDGSSGTFTGGNIYFGAGKDAEIYYDGTDLRINPKLVGSGEVQIDGDHNITGEAKGERMVYTAMLSGSILTGSYLTMGGLGMSATKGYRMPRAGSIVGISIQTNINTFSVSGDLSVQARVNGTNVFQTTVAISADGDTGGQATQARGTDTFSAGDLLTLFVNIESGTYVISGPVAVVEVQYDT